MKQLSYFILMNEKTITSQFGTQHTFDVEALNKILMAINHPS